MEHQLHSGTAKLTLVGGNREPVRNLAADSTANAEKISARLPSILQTTLELEKLILLFEEQIKPVLPFDSFHYMHAGVSCHIDTDTAHHHRCHYKLEMNGVYLGELTLTRRRKFSPEQIKLLEDLLCLLVYPLRNCLLYRQALASALLDNLTGIGNRAAFDSSLEREVDLARRQQSHLSLIVLDIDNFKAINDTYGHISGDRALKTLADTIVNTMRRSDIAFRFGGEEFVLLLSNTDTLAANIVAERIRVAVSQLLCHDGKRTFGFTVSLGIAQLEADEHSYHLFERADMALYQAKQTGRNATVCAPRVSAGAH
jgi:diguanylate cyclase (GGDEF)-like protein